MSRKQSTLVFHLESTANLTDRINWLKAFPHKEDGKEIRELLTINLYSYSLFKLKKLCFPYTCYKTETPDFKIENGENNINIEHTRACSPNLKMAEEVVKKHHDGTLIELSYYSSEQTPSKAFSKIGIRAPGESLSGAGWIGDALENSWVDFILTSINKKSSDYKYKGVDCSNWELIVEDEVPGGFNKDFDTSMDKLKKKYFASKLTSFKAVHLFTSKKNLMESQAKPIFVYDVFGLTKITDVAHDQLHL